MRSPQVISRLPLTEIEHAQARVLAARDELASLNQHLAALRIDRLATHTEPTLF
jgi:hypothetical protein